MAKKLIAFVSGSSGSGKNTIINRLIEENENYGFITSYTTRDKRPTDVEGKNYYFISKEEFENKVKSGDMLEFDFFSNNYYGIGKQAIQERLKEKQVVLKDITVAGVKNSKERLEGEKIVSFFFTADKKVLIDRLKKRGEKNIKDRMKFYKSEQKRMFNSDYVVHNVDLEETMSSIKTLIDLELNGKYFLPLISCQQILDKKINKYVNKLNKNKKLKPIKVATVANKVYIVEGVYRYLAALKCGKHICKILLNEHDFEIPQDLDVKEWNKLVKMYI